MLKVHPSAPAPLDPVGGKPQVVNRAGFFLSFRGCLPSALATSRGRREEEIKTSHRRVHVCKTVWRFEIRCAFYFSPHGSSHHPRKKNK